MLNDTTVGTNNLEDLYNTSSDTGIRTDINGWLIIELDK